RRGGARLRVRLHDQARRKRFRAPRERRARRTARRPDPARVSGPRSRRDREPRGPRRGRIEGRRVRLLAFLRSPPALGAAFAFVGALLVAALAATMALVVLTGSELEDTAAPAEALTHIR